MKAAGRMLPRSDQALAILEAQPRRTEADGTERDLVFGYAAVAAGIYNKALYRDERRRALERWAQHVAGVVVGRVDDKVVAMRGRRRRARP
jgi:hypothetical protein